MRRKAKQANVRIAMRVTREVALNRWDSLTLFKDYTLFLSRTMQAAWPQRPYEGLRKDGEEKAPAPPTTKFGYDRQDRQRMRACRDIDLDMPMLGGV